MPEATVSALAARVLEALRSHAVFAPADKKGKFPMGEMRPSADGSQFDSRPLAYATTQETFDNVRAVYAAAFALAEEILLAEVVLPSPTATGK
jgi:hypothetical protein